MPIAYDDPALGASMQTLAASALAQLGGADDDTLLANRTILQLAAGEYARAAEGARIQRDHLRSSGNPQISPSVAIEIFARAKAAQADSDRSFDESFRSAFETVFAGLDDRLAYDTWYFLGILPQNLGASFRATLEQYRAPTRVSVQQAIELVRGYAWWQASMSFFTLIDPLSTAEWQRRYVIEDGVLAKTPDGAHVSAIIVRPRTTTRLPALLNFGIYAYPGWVTNTMFDAILSASHGYVGVVGFSRGKYTSRDAIVPYEKDGSDARALINWISHQSWSDGRVGMYGGSYNTFTQWSALKDPPPALRAIMSSAAAAPGIGEVTEGGIFRTYVYPWVPYTTKGPMLDEDGYNDRAHWTGLEKKWYLSGRPYRDLELIDGVPSPIYRRWLQHPTYDSYWQQMTPQGKEFANIRIPVLQTTGYFDGGQISTIHYFSEHHKYNTNAEDTLLIGPYDHLGSQHQSAYVVGGYPIDATAWMDIAALRYQWFDYVLKGAARPAILKDVVNYEVMGANEWRHAASLEAMSSKTVRLHLAPGSGPATNHLIANSPSAGVFVEQRIDLADRTDVDWLPPADADDVLNKTLDTHNALAFVSDPFPQDTEVSGLVRGALDFITNKKDFDFSVRLYELTPSGEYLRLNFHYLQRTSLAPDRSHRQLLVPNTRQHLPFVMPGPVGCLIKAGGRFVVVLGINKERDSEINYGTGKEVSTESISDAGDPLRVQWFSSSYIEIPVGR